MCVVFQARQVLEREFNNVLALGTDRRLEEVCAPAAALIKYNITEMGPIFQLKFFPCTCRVEMTSLSDALHRGEKGLGHVREEQDWA